MLEILIVLGISAYLCSGLIMAWLPNLNVGDEVFWCDPKDPKCFGIYTVEEIKYKGDCPEEDILTIKLDDGAEVEVFRYEIE